MELKVWPLGRCLKIGAMGLGCLPTPSSWVLVKGNKRELAIAATNRILFLRRQMMAKGSIHFSFKEEGKREECKVLFVSPKDTTS